MKQLFQFKKDVCNHLPDNTIGILFCVGVVAVALSVLHLCSPSIIYNPLRPVTTRAVHFDSRANGKAFVLVKDLQEDSRAALKEIHISFKMKVYSIGQYNNVFQTGARNSGIRMELLKPGRLGLVIGSKGEDTSTGFVITEYLKLAKEYLVDLHITRTSRVVVRLNGALAVNDIGKQLTFQVSDIAVGTGMNKSRPFDGSIDDFQIRYQGFTCSKHAAKAVRFAEWLLIAILVVLLVVLYSSAGSQKSLRELWFSSGSSKYLYGSIFFACLLAFLTTDPLVHLFKARAVEPLSINNYVIFLILTVIFFTALLVARRVVLQDAQSKSRFVALILLSGFVASYLVLYTKAIAYNDDVSIKSILLVVHRFKDFYNLRSWPIHQLYSGAPEHGYEIRWVFNYFPAAYLVTNVFVSQGDSGLIQYLALFSTYFFFYSFFSLKRIKLSSRMGYSLIFLCLSFPTMLTISTGNNEGMLFIFLSLFVLLYKRGSGVLSSFCLGMAIAMKLAPGVFLILLISDKRYKQLVYALLFAVLLTVFALAIYDGGFNGGLLNYCRRMGSILASWSDVSIIRGLATEVGCSLFCALRLLAGPHFPPVASLLRPWLLFSLVVFAALSVYVVVYERTTWKKLMILTCGMTLLQYVSFDYKLIHFFIPMFLFFNDDTPDKYSASYLLLLGLLFIPKHYIDLWLPAVLDPFVMIFMVVFVVVSHGRISLRPLKVFRLAAGPVASERATEDI